MKYIINNKVTFMVSEKKLESEGAVAYLTNPSCRLLIALLGGNNRVMSREDLLTKVWEDFGLSSSESSLNNNVSILRKKLGEVGISHAIETIPKKGFKLSVDDVRLESMTPDLLVREQPVINGCEKNHVYYNLKKNILNNRNLCIVFSFIGVVVFYSLFSIMKFNVSKYKKVGVIDNCQIYHFGNEKIESVRDFFSTARGGDILSNCNKDSVLFYDDVNNGNKKNEHSNTISICNMENGKIHECKNFVSIVNSVGV